MNQQTPNVLYYSQKCKMCRILITIMENIGILSNFYLICVDDKLHALPPQIKKVPTLITQSIDRPLTGKDAIKWVNAVRLMRQQAMLTQMNQKIMLRNKLMNGGNGPLGFVDEEMGGFSDNFAYTKADVSVPHAHFSVGTERSNAIFTAPEVKKKVKRSDQDKMVKDELKKREDQSEKYKDVMLQQQAQAVLHAENSGN